MRWCVVLSETLAACSPGSRSRMSQEFRPLLGFDGLSPAGRATRQFSIDPNALLSHFESTFNRSMYLEAWLVPDVVLRPSGIWRGLGREGQDEALCYAGKPTGEFAASHAKKIEIPDDLIFLVYATKQLVVTKWRFCRPDADNPAFPKDHDSRYGERLWPKTLDVNSPST
jgi:hypothetical protein